MDLESPVLGGRCHSFIDLLDFGRNSPCLLADLPANAAFIGVASITVARSLDGGPAWTWETHCSHAAAPIAFVQPCRMLWFH